MHRRQYPLKSMNAVFWDLVSCSLANIYRYFGGVIHTGRCFGGTCSPHLLWTWGKYFPPKWRKTSTFDGLRGVIFQKTEVLRNLVHQSGLMSTHYFLSYNLNQKKCWCIHYFSIMVFPICMTTNEAGTLINTVSFPGLPSDSVVTKTLIALHTRVSKFIALCVYTFWNAFMPIQLGVTHNKQLL